MPEPMSFIHDTEDGLIHLWAAKANAGGWNARFWGGQLAGGAHFKTLEEALNHLSRRFAEMFPEHVCSIGCGASGAVAARIAAEQSAWFSGALEVDRS